MGHFSVAISIYNQNSRKDTKWAPDHDRIISLLRSLKESGKIANFSIEELGKAFPTKDSEKAVLDRLRNFSIRHHVGLAQLFGSRKHGFCYLPNQFLFVLDGGELKEVFPHEVEGIKISILRFLEPFAQGKPWTQYSVPPRRKTGHEDLIEKIMSNPNILEPKLEFTGRNVHVSGDFSERGYVDLVFRGGESRYLLLEVKVKPVEIDKAIGQILRHRELFAKQNFLAKEAVRLGIACPSIPVQARKICGSLGIKLFELS